MTRRSVELARRLEEILDRLQRLVIAIDADMGDARRRHQIEHAFEQAVAGAQDRGEDQLLALEVGDSIFPAASRSRSSSVRDRASPRSQSSARSRAAAPEAGVDVSLLRMMVSLCCTSG
jgi:hypothetical protein